MGKLVFKSKPAAPSAAKPSVAKSASKPVPLSTPKASASPAKPAWFKTGEAVKQAMIDEDTRIEKRIEDNSRMWRFYMKEGDKKRITFVDGHLLPSGLINVFAFREHTLNINGSWDNHYPCTAEQEPCPICEQGDDASLIHMLTIVDHTENKGKKGVYKDMPRLFPAKRKTMQLLQSIASASGGLSGCTFEVTRSGENSANVGSEFKFIEKTDLKVLAKRHAKKITEGKNKGKVIDVFAKPDYTAEVVYRTAAELRKLGFGAKSPIGGEAGLTEDADADVDAELG